MPKLIVIRLHPDKPVTGDKFAAYLSRLIIEVADASFTDPTGKGSYALAVIKIVQHTMQVGPVTELLPVATAIIVLPDSTLVEYAEPDLMLYIDIKLKNGAMIIQRFPVDYNVAVAEVDTIPDNPAGFRDLEPVAAYVALPISQLGLEKTDAVVVLPKDGAPPNFKELLDAVKKVLAGDPGKKVKVDLATLSLARCRHIAHEIAWNRHVAPLPLVSADALERMYTVSGEESEGKERANARLQFEAALTQYRAVHDAEAEVLTRYIVALSAAIACENKSVAAKGAGLRFPIQPGVSQSSQAQEAEVALEN